MTGDTPCGAPIPCPFKVARERIKDALAAVEALEAEAWQPIETAPKDGTPIILGAIGVVEVGYWEDFRKAETECGVPIECDVDEGWYGSLDIYPAGKQPAHWRPLPAPPVTEAR